MAHISATGYVHRMIDGKQDFRAFAMSCARAFGDLIDMRDEPMDAIEPSNYHVEALAKAKSEVAALEAMDEAQRLAFGESAKAKAIELWRTSESERLADVAVVKAMITNVEAWSPPTPDHVEMKNFMLEQLRSSIKYEDDDSYAANRLQQAIKKDTLSFYEDAVSAARHSVEYHAEEHRKEVERCKQRTEWLQSLVRSLPPKQ
jgi:hypothetical protein